MTEPLRPAYLILGDDGPQVELALKRLRRRIAQDSGTDLNIDEFNAQPGNAAQVVAAANTLAFLGGTRLVMVHGAQAWQKADKEKLAAYLRSPAPDACLALVADKLPATDSLRKAAQAAGMVLEYWAPKKEDLIKWLQKQAHKANLELGAPMARLLVQRVGEHQHVLLREVEKLAAYKDGGPLSAADIELLCSQTLEASVFSLTDALAIGAAARAFSVLEELYAAGEDASGLFYRVLWHFEKLARTVALRVEGRSQEEAVRELGLHPFAARKLWQQAREVTPEAVRTALGALAEADAQMKGRSNLPPDLVFELCLGRILDARVPVGTREE